MKGASSGLPLFLFGIKCIGHDGSVCRRDRNGGFQKLSKFTIPQKIEYSDAHAVFEFALKARKAQAERDALPHVLASANANLHHPGIWQMLGLFYRTLDQLEPALEAFQHASTLAPYDATIAHGYARVALEAGLPATDLFNRAQQLAPADGAVLIGRSAAQLAEGAITTAISDLEMILQNNPAWQDGHAALARLYWMSGDQQRLTGSLEKALARLPNNPSLWSQMILTLFQTRQFEQVLEAIKKARSDLDQEDAFLFFEACSLAELGSVSAADRLFSVIGDTDNSMIVEYLTRHLLRSGRSLEASEFSERFLNGPAHNLILPYAYLAWRLLRDDRWSRIENDPKLLGVYDISHQLPALGQLSDSLRGLHITSHEPMEQSVRGGTQTDGPLLSRIDPIIQHLRKGLVKTIEKHAAKLSGSNLVSGFRYSKNLHYGFAGSWSVLLRGAGHHANHIHQAGWLSSALYVDLPEQQEMGPEPAGWFTIGQPPIELEIDLPPILTIEPKPGRLVLFPSSMWHGTNPIKGGERLTVAFDVAPPVAPNLNY